MVNIPSMHGGSNLWGEPKKADRQNVSEEKLYEVITDPEALKISSQGETSLFAFPYIFWGGTYVLLDIIIKVNFLIVIFDTRL